MGYACVCIAKEPPITWITLNRPSAMNALTKGMVDELIMALDDAEKDERTRVVILRGNGRAFCAGMDLKEHTRNGDATGDIGFSGLWEKIQYLEKPVIAAVHGYAITGGFLLAYSCDLIVASESARFADTHAKLGLIPTGGETQRLPRRVGLAKAKELMFTSNMIGAQEAEKIGLVNAVVPEGQLDAAAATLAQKIASNSARSIRILKNLLNKSVEVDFSSGMRLEAQANKRGKANLEQDEDRDRRLAQFSRRDP